MIDYNLNNQKSNLELKKSLKFIFSLLGKDRFKLIIVVLSVLISATSNILTPVLITKAIDQYIQPRDLTGLNYLLVWLLLIYIITAVVSYLQTRLVGQIAQTVLFDLKHRLFDHIQQMPLDFFQANKSGDIITRINTDTEKLNNFLSSSIFQFISSFFTFIGIGLFIFTLNWKLSLVVWLAVFVVVIISLVTGKFIAVKNQLAALSTSQANSFLEENFNNFKALVVFNKSEYLIKSFESLNKDIYKKNILAQTLNSWFNPIYSFAGNISQIMVLLFGLHLLVNGELTLGLLIGFISYTQKFYEPLRTLGNIWGSMQEAIAAWIRVEKLLNLDTRDKKV